jgi:probable rRNA maturation factor
MKPRSPRSVETAVDVAPRPRGLTRLSRFCASALESAGYSSWSIEVLLCSDERMAALNERYRGRTGPTDVLSFPRDETAPADSVSGDIAISVETLRRNAARFGVSENEEMKRLLVHGLLHLAGMDHGSGKSGAMLARQARILRELRSDVIYGEGRK